MFFSYSPWWLVFKMHWPSNWQTNTREWIFNLEKKKRKYEKSRRKERKLVYNSMESNINWLKCRPNSKEHTITTTLFKNLESKQRSNMRSFKSNMRTRRRRLMTNSKEFLRLKRSWINLTEPWSKLRSIMKLWSPKLLLQDVPHTELKNQLSTLKSKRKVKITWSIQWMKRLRG